MTRVTVGQYYPSDSPVHRLDPRLKLLAALFFISSLFFVNRFAGYGIAAVFIFSVIALSRVPVKLLLRGLRSIFIILLFAAALNLFLTPGERVVFSYSFIRITYEGLTLAGKMAVRLILLIVGSSALTFTTSPKSLTDAIEYLLKPFEKIKVPAHEIAMMMTIALGSIPMLMDETDKIMKAQTARGADFVTGGLIKRAKSLIPVLVPLFVSAFRRADEMASAMDARCYRGGKGRTKMNAMKAGRYDLLAAGCILIYGFLLFFTRF